MSECYDVVILGAGPAGLAASIYAKRAGLNGVTLEQNPAFGGQIINTYEVDNYPGLKGINGFDLGMKFREHADALGCAFLEERVLRIEKAEAGFKITTDAKELLSRTVIAATGAEHALLKIPGEEELSGMGVSYCATCDGAFFKGRDVVVIGGGDVAVEDAVFLARGCRKVYLMHRRDTLRAAASLSDKLMALPNVEILWDTVPVEIKGEDQVEGVLYQNVKTGQENTLAVSGVFIAVGIVPLSGLLQGLVALDEKGYVLAGEDCVTDVPGFFAAGDLRKKNLRQVVTAVADGANAVTGVERYLNSL